ncbi:Transcriptional regulator, TetR family [Sphingobium herbicidovorans NBRC 16415]|jgi:TetR/AcrR family transcriptional regulator|uniref:Transcriptional regulator, TetR family n=1 Tax=Sphingobium herbicidovorans (strain ATCC 700291 / DSM 11019 / CCUG 56400 / KCTC 2939 / LMG 18315 / NBRC 16415 / MH) TaxID=1219045 RepID=A0A086PEZ4_SPHHM|nr:TetR/AcrR family transcriptional regulator [Sphingobium herbicidovorans]KFG91962.1 Transcriptional regulator, TetR family [Sphingobium herbicidovorans NBRC 16415]
MTAIKPTTRQPRGDATRRQILDEAERIFADIGYAAARLDHVADAVGIRRPSIIYYFPGKQQLYEEVEADIFASMHAFVLNRTEGVGDPMARLLALLDAWLDFLVGRPTAARIIQRLIADSATHGDNPVRFSETALRDIEDVVTAGVASGQFGQVSAMVLLNTVAAGALHYVCNGRQLGPGRSYDPANPQQLAEFRAMMHRLAKAAVAPE